MNEWRLRVDCDVLIGWFIWHGPAFIEKRFTYDTMPVTFGHYYIILVYDSLASGRASNRLVIKFWETWIRYIYTPATKRINNMMAPRLLGGPDGPHLHYTYFI